MGKSNRRRERERKPRAPRGAVPIVSDLSDLREHLRFKSEEEAFGFFEEAGFHDIRLTAPFPSSTLAQHLELNLGGSFRVCDATHLLPTGHDPALPAYSKLGVELLEESSHAPDKVFLVVRTRQNAIGFAAGFVWGIANVSNESLEDVLERVKRAGQTDLPYALLFAQGRTCVLPTVVLQHSVVVASQVAKSLVLGTDSTDFRCAICCKSIIKKAPNSQTMQIHPFLVPQCYHPVHRNCIYNVLADPDAYPGCVTCCELLPRSWVAVARRDAEQKAQKAQERLQEAGPPDESHRREAAVTESPISAAKLASAMAACSVAPSPSALMASATSSEDTEGVRGGGA